MSEPPSSNARAVPKSRLGMSIALMSTPPLMVRPLLRRSCCKPAPAGSGCRAGRRRRWPCSASRLARSITSSARRTWLLAVAVGTAGDDFAADGAPHVGHFFGPLVDQQHDQVHVGMVRSPRPAAMCCSRMVLPVRGGATIRPRWPLPMGVSRSMTRVVSGRGRFRE